MVQKAQESLPKLLVLVSMFIMDTVHYDHGIEQKVQSTDKIFKIAWEYRNGKYDRVDKEIKFEEFHDWLIEKLSGE